jgi:hypothetical protein
MRGMSGSGPFGAEAHICWFGHPSQASALPAWSDSGPGQCSGSGAARVGATRRDAVRAEVGDCVDLRVMDSVREGDIG